MKYIIFLFLLIGTTASAQKVLVKQGTVNGIYVWPATGSDSATFTARGCGTPLTNMTAYRAVYRAGAVYVDTCANKLYFYTPSLNKWFQVDASVPAGATIYFVEDSTNTQPGSPADSTYYLLGGVPSGAQWSGFTANSIAFYNGSWSNIAGVLNDYAFTLDDQVYHQYNGTTWPIASGINLLNGGNTGQVRAGSTTANYFDLITNNTRALSFNRYQNATFYGTLFKMPSIRAGLTSDSLVVIGPDGLGKISPQDYAGFILASPASKQHKIADIDTLTAYKSIADTNVQRSSDVLMKAYITGTNYNIDINSGGSTGKNFSIGNNAQAGGFGTGTWNANFTMPPNTSFTAQSANILNGASITGDGLYFGSAAYGANPLGIGGPFITGGAASANNPGQHLLIYGGDATTGVTTDLAAGNAVMSSGKSTGSAGGENEFWTTTGAASGTSYNTPTLKAFQSSLGDFRYMGNYGTYFTDTSLVDKNYVDSVAVAGGASLPTDQIFVGTGSGYAGSADLTWNGNQLLVGVDGASSVLRSTLSSHNFSAGDIDGAANSNVLAVSDVSNKAYYDNAAHTGFFGINTISPAVALDVVGLIKNGSYGDGTNTGTPTFAAAWDASGNVIETALSSGTVNSGTAGQLAYYTGTGTAVSGTTTGTGVLTALGVNVGSAGAFVVNGGAGGTPSSLTLTNATGLPLTTGVTGILPDANYEYVKGYLGSTFNASNTIAAATTNYISVQASLAFTGTEAIRSWTAPGPGTLRDLAVETSSTQSATGSFVLTVRKNGVNTAVTITIAAGAAAGPYYDNTNSFTFVKGDKLSISGLNNASVTSTSILSAGCIITNY